MDYEILAGLDEADRRAVLAACTRHRYARGEVVFHQDDLGDKFHHIASGRVTIQVSTSRGDVAMIAVLGRGEGFGEQALLGLGQRRTASAVALEPTRTLALSRTQFEDLRTTHPTVDDLLLAHLARHVRRLTDLYVETLFLPAEKRVLRRLLDLEELYDGAEIAVTQEDLASLAGTTRPTANRALQAAVDAGEVTASRGRLLVVDRESLARRAR